MSKGIAEEDIFVNYTPFGHSDWSKIVADVVALGADGKKVGVISTINGDANIGFYKELAAAGVSADDIPVVAFSVGEEELSGLDTIEPRRPPGGVELLPVGRHAGERGIHRSLERLHRRRPRDQRPDGGALHRLQHVGERGRRRPAPPMSMRCARRCTARSSRT